MMSSFPPEALAFVLDALTVRVFWKDRESRFLGCNKAFADDAGIADRAEFIGRSDYYFYHPEQASEFRRDDAEVMFADQPKLGIVEKLTKMGGEVIWLETNKWPIHDDKGQVIGVLGMYQDITERMRAEQIAA